MIQTAAVIDALGGRRTLGKKVSTPSELRTLLRTGLPHASLEAVMERFHLAREEVSLALDLPKRTLARRKAARRLPADESDRVLRLTRIAVMAEEVFGDRDKAIRWLHRPNRALGSEVPLALLNTDIGARQVEDLLGRIEHGVVS